MTRVRSITEIGSLYETVLHNARVIEEKASSKTSKFPKNTFPAAHEEVKEPSTFKNTGPGTVKNVKPIHRKKKGKKNTRKRVSENINSFMKSKFDKLFENVMDDDIDMNLNSGPGTGPEGEAGDMGDDLDLGEDDSEEMGGDEVTLTLDREIAQKLVDMLQAAIGGDEGMGEESDLEDLEIDDTSSDMDSDEDFDIEDEDEEEERRYGHVATEETGTEKLSDASGHKLTKGMEAAGNIKANKGKASSDVTDEVGTKTHGDPMDHKSGLTKPGNNKVSNLKTGSPLFGNR